MDFIRKLATMYLPVPAHSGIEPVKADTSKHFDELSDEQIRCHLVWMLHEVAEKNWVGSKDHRWVGFVQGALWAMGYFTIDDLREHTNKAKGSVTGEAISPDF